MDEGITERIKKAKLTKKERLVMEMITREIDKTAFLNGVNLAEYCGVSATFITRLIQKLGYEKFADFRENLGILYKKTTTPYDMFQSFMAVGNRNDIVKNSILQDFQNLSNMENMIDYHLLEKVVSTIEDGKTIYLAAMFASEIAVHALTHYLYRLGKTTKKVTGIGLSKKLEFSDIGPGDVLIAVSSQRVLREIVDGCYYAKKKGARTICITDNGTNPLAYASDYVLIAPVRGVAVDYTHVATLAMVNVIINCMAAKSPEVVAENLERDEKDWADKNLFCL